MPEPLLLPAPTPAEPTKPTEPMVSKKLLAAGMLVMLISASFSFIGHYLPQNEAFADIVTERGLPETVEPSVVTPKDSVALDFKTTTVKDTGDEPAQARSQELADSLHALVSTSLTLHIGADTKTLDLNSDEDFVILGNSSAEPNNEKILAWVKDLEREYYRASSTITITGKEEIRKGVNKAVTSGEFKEGSHIIVEELYPQILEMLKTDQRDLTVKLHEIPVKVVSDLDNSSYEILATGYSEYSTGSAMNRVHNIETGLGRLNGILIDPGQAISFNKMVGDVDGDFRMGWGIFGKVALPTLGGGLCQVSTTMYRALLALGIPITMRAPHSWDLSYYQKGGYGLDATVFPEKGVDVKAVNDYDSSLFFYTYTRPETKEAFILVYGKGDGRKVSLNPEEEYTPRHGSKTLKWKQLIEMPNGETKENEIVTHYRA